MKTQQLARLLVLSFGWMFSTGCSNSSTDTTGGQTELILNGGFESGGVASLTGWTIPIGQLIDTALFSRDVPIGGGSYSVQLYPGWFPMENRVEYDVVGRPSGVYKLTAWSKVGWGSSIGIGSISLARRSGGLMDRKKLLLNDTVWKKYTLLDTVSLGATDTLAVILSAGMTEVVSFQQRFDLVSLVRVE